MNINTNHGQNYLALLQYIFGSISDILVLNFKQVIYTQIDAFENYFPIKSYFNYPVVCHKLPEF
jgi:hypothetical protein